MVCVMGISGAVLRDLLHDVLPSPNWMVYLAVMTSSSIGLFHLVAFILDPAVTHGFTRYLNLNHLYLSDEVYGLPASNPTTSSAMSEDLSQDLPSFTVNDGIGFIRMPPKARCTQIQTSHGLVIK